MGYDYGVILRTASRQAKSSRILPSAKNPPDYGVVGIGDENNKGRTTPHPPICESYRKERSTDDSLGMDPFRHPRTRAMMSSKLQFDFSLVHAFVVMHCIIGDLGQRGDDSMQASITAPSGRADNRGSVRVCE